MKYVYLAPILFPLLSFAQTLGSLQVIDTDNQSIVSTLSLSSPLTLDRTKLPKNFNFNVVVSNPSSVSFVRSQLLYEGQKDKQREDGTNYQRDDKKAPFAVGGEDAGVFKPLTLGKNKYSLNLVSTSKTGQTSSKAISLSLTGVYAPPQPLSQFEKYQIIDVDKNEVAATFPASASLELDLSKLPKNFNISVGVTNPSSVSFLRSQLLYEGQVDKIREDGTSYQRDDKLAPFAIGSEGASVYRPLKLGKDKYSLSLVISMKDGKTVSKKVDLTVLRPVQNPDDLGALKVFPKADNFPGSDSQAGRGGKICRVNRLADDLEAGSFRHCVSQNYPRIIVFEVSGTIKLNSVLTVNHPYVTIAGQTAPAPGITLYGNTFRIQTKEVLIQHVSIRLGNESGQRDAVEVFYYSDKVNGKSKCDRPAVENVVFDHVAISWGIDGSFDLQNLGCADKIRNVSIVDSFITEHLNDSIHGEGKHSFASLVGHGSRNIGILRNLYAHNVARNPRIDSNVQAQVINNYMYNVGWHGVEVRNASSMGELPSIINIINNVQGVSNTFYNKSAPALIGIQTRVGFVKNSIYTEGNEPYSKLYYITAPNKPAGEPLITAAEVFATAPVLSLEGINILPANEVKDHIIQKGGPRPHERDKINARLIDQMKIGLGKVIDAPDAAELAYLKENSSKPVNSRPFPEISNPDVDEDNDGWTVMDKVLYGYSKDVSLAD